MTWCVVAGGSKSSEDHTPKVPTTGLVINPNTLVCISQYDKCRESCSNLRTGKDKVHPCTGTEAL